MQQTSDAIDYTTNSLLQCERQFIIPKLDIDFDVLYDDHDQTLRVVINAGNLKPYAGLVKLLKRRLITTNFISNISIRTDKIDLTFDTAYVSITGADENCSIEIEGTLEESILKEKKGDEWITKLIPIAHY
jgi:hypothetical protein